MPNYKKITSFMLNTVKLKIMPTQKLTPFFT